MEVALFIFKYLNETKRILSLLEVILFQAEAKLPLLQLSAEMRDHSKPVCFLGTCWE